MSKIKIFKINKNYSIMTIIILFIIISLLKDSAEYLFQNLNEVSIIKLVLNKGTNQRILSSNYEDNLPNTIIVNGINHDSSYIISNYLYSLQTNNITLIWTNGITNCANMFRGLNNIISIDMSKFDFSKVNNMAYMFYDCSSLKYLNLNNINTSSVTAMHDIFYGCSSIEYLNLYSLNTSRVGCLCEMFYGCSSLLYINMINLNDPSGCAYNNIFYSCNSRLKYTFTASKAPNFANLLSTYTPCLYVSSDYYDEYNDNCFIFCLFGSSNDTLADNCFDKCYNHYDYSKIQCFSSIPAGYFVNDTINDKIIAKCNENCKTCDYQSYTKNLCISCNIQSNYYPIMNNTDYYICTEHTPERFYFSDNSHKPCYDKCKTCSQGGNNLIHNCESCFLNYELLDSNCICNYFYFFNNQTNLYDCLFKCPIDHAFISKDNICLENCDSLDLFLNECRLIELNQELKDYLTLKIKESILNGELDDIIYNEIEQNKEDLFLKFPDIIYQITSSENQNNNKDKYNDTSNIQLGNCEAILRSQYNFQENDKIIIFKIDVKEENYNIPFINYEFYNIRTKEVLNLSNCDNSTMKVYLPSDNVEENNLDKYNKSGGYYNDVCYSYSENGLDISTKDRKNVFNNNHLSLCESKCEYKGYDIDTKKSECECQFKLTLSNISDIIENKDKLIERFTDIKSQINLNVVKCYKELFAINGIIKNIGSYILLLMILLNIICLFLFLFKGYKNLQITIDELTEQKASKVKFENIETTITKKKRKKKINKDIIKENNRSVKSVKTSYISSQNKRKKNLEIISNKNHKEKLPINSKSKIKKIKKNINNKKNDHMDTKSVSNNTSKFDFKNKSKFKSPKNKKNKKIGLNDYELEILTYKEAIKFDKRSYCDYYFSLLKRRQLILFTFITKNDYNIRSVKLSMFIIFLSLSFAVNTLFFTDDTLHNIIIVKGKFNILYQLPKIIYSSLISSVINTAMLTLALSEKNVVEIKNEKGIKTLRAKKVKNILKAKFLFFFVIGFLLLFIFWYYISCFCLVYSNTQLYVLEDTAINFALSCIYPFGFCLLPGIFRIISLRAKKRKKECIYNFAKFLRTIIS